MKKYEKPEISITTLKNEDIITLSGGVKLATSLKPGYNEIDAF